MSGWECSRCHSYFEDSAPLPAGAKPLCARCADYLDTLRPKSAEPTERVASFLAWRRKHPRKSMLQIKKEKADLDLAELNSVSATDLARAAREILDRTEVPMPEPAQSPDQPTPEIHRSVEQMARLRGLVKLTEPWVCGCGSSLSRLNTKAIHQKTCDGKPYPKPCACGKMLPSQEARHNHYARCPRAKEKRDRNRKDAQGRRPGEEGYLGYPVPIPTLVTTASAAQPPATLTTHASALDLALAALQQDGTELVALSVSALDSSPKAMLAKAREVERLSHAVVELLAGRLTTDASDSDASDSC